MALPLCLALLVPAAASGETRTFVNTQFLFPSAGAGASGPANHYPSTINVANVPGTVTKATVTLIGYGSSSPDDTDAVLAGPNGQSVMLMSDSCGLNPNTLDDVNVTFDDAAPTFLSNPGPCPNGGDVIFKPSNYEDPALDDQSAAGGPVPPYLNALSVFNGASPDGAWKLFVLDDDAFFVGFRISGWALTLEVEPPGPPGDATVLDTTITQKPKDKTKKKTATFEFTASEPGATFECSLDGEPFSACSPPDTLRVKKGKHHFEVRATDAAGNVDGSPASDDWKVRQKK